MTSKLQFRKLSINMVLINAQEIFDTLEICSINSDLRIQKLGVTSNSQQCLQS